MVSPVEFKFEIKAYSPATMPMARLARYLDILAKILGETKSVHLIRVDQGSTAPVLTIDWEAVPKIKKRTSEVRNNEGPAEVQAARRDIEKCLAEDNAQYGDLVEMSSGARVVRFPGASRSPRLEYGPFSQQGTLDGIPIVVGGENDPVPVHLDGNGRVYNCIAIREIAKNIGAHLFTNPIRVTGDGRWFRDPDGDWMMKRFKIDSFIPLSVESFKKSTERLQSIDAKWKHEPDPIGDLIALREEEEEA